jgi:hypothetical protein
MNFDEFLQQAGSHGPCVGIRVATQPARVSVPGIEFRTICGSRTDTLGNLLDSFAEAWQFPKSPSNSRDAFNDWMRDFDNLTNPSLSKPPASGYVTEISDAHLILTAQPDMFPWFANELSFYRDYYRDDLEPPAAFAVILSTTADLLDEVRTRWISAGAHVAEIDG